MDPKAACCCRRFLFNQPDFAAQKPAIIELVESHGHIAFFYPKFHCELNFIEQAWGAAKYRYRISVGEVRSRADWDPVWTGPNSAVPVPVWDFPKKAGPLGLRSGQSHIGRDGPRPGLDQDRLNYLSNESNVIFLIQLLLYRLLTKLLNIK